MSTNRRIYVAIAALALAVITVLGWQRREMAKLGGEIATLNAQTKKRARVTAENRRLLAAQVTAQEMERLRAERALVSELREEIEAMKGRAEVAARTGAIRNTTTTKTQAPPPTLKERALLSAEWRNAGRRTPEATLETALWASAGGEVEALENLFAFDAEARTKAEALFSSLPKNIQDQFGSPARLIALLTAKDVPLGSAQIMGQFPSATGTRLIANLLDADENSKTVLFNLQADGDRWLLVVPGNVVDRYTKALRMIQGREPGGN